MNWGTSLGSCTVNMSTSALVGLNNTSHNTNALCTVVFENVSVTTATPTPTPTATPTPTVLNPVADSFVRDGSYSSTNYGSDTTLDVKDGLLPNYTRNAYLKFDLSSVSSVSSAKVRVYGCDSQDSTVVSVKAYAVDNDSWSESTITFNNAPANNGTQLGAVSIGSTPQYLEFDVTTFVISQFAGDKLVTIEVLTNLDEDRVMTFNSKENTSNKPELVIN